jgi:hypothetical protein
MKSVVSSILFLLFATALFAGENEEITFYGDARYKLMEEAFQYSDSVAAVQEQPLSGFKAALYSALLPGAGQVYAGSYWRAALYATLEVAAWTAYIVYEKKGDDEDLTMRNFADDHWLPKKYWSKIYQLASESGEFPYEYQVDDNMILVELTPEMLVELRKVETDFPNHTHTLPVTKTQQYYEMIYKYLKQFGNGWDDASFDITYDGISDIMTTNMRDYRDMRNLSEDFYAMAGTATMVALVNHVVSALDAAWTVRNHNRRLETNFSVRNKLINYERVRMYGLNFSW